MQNGDESFLPKCESHLMTLNVSYPNMRRMEPQSKVEGSVWL